MLTLLAEFINLYKKRFVLVILLTGIGTAVLAFFILASFNQLISGLNKIKGDCLNKAPSTINHTVSFTDWAEESYDLNREETVIAAEDSARLKAIQKTQQKAHKIAGWLNVKLGNTVNYLESLDNSTPFKIRVTVTLSYELLK